MIPDASLFSASQARMEQKVDDILRQLAKIDSMMNEMNKTSRAHGEIIVAHGQQIEMLDRRVSEVSARANWIGALNATLAAVMSAIITFVKNGGAK